MIFRLLLCLPAICLCVSHVKKARGLSVKKICSELLLVGIVFGGLIVSALSSIVLVLIVPELSFRTIMLCLCCQAMLIAAAKGIASEGFRKDVCKIVFVLAFCGVMYEMPELAEVAMWDAAVGYGVFLWGAVWILGYSLITSKGARLLLFSQFLQLQSLFGFAMDTPFDWLVCLQFFFVTGLNIYGCCYRLGYIDVYSRKGYGAVIVTVCMVIAVFSFAFVFGAYPLFFTEQYFAGLPDWALHLFHALLTLSLSHIFTDFP